MAESRARRPKRTGSGPAIVVLSIEIPASSMDEIECLADRRDLPVRIFAATMINEIVDTLHERSMSDEEARYARSPPRYPAIPRQALTPPRRGTFAVLDVAAREFNVLRAKDGITLGRAADGTFAR